MVAAAAVTAKNAKMQIRASICFYYERMRKRVLGRTGIEVSEIGYGAWGIGGMLWQGGTDDESIRAVRRAFEVGLNFIDTALAYWERHSRRLVGALACPQDSIA